MDKLVGLLKSRKFWAAGVSLGVIVASSLSDGKLQLSETELLALVTTIVGYIFGVAIEDNGARKA